MSKNTVMKILMAVGVAGSALCTAGIVPGIIAPLFTVLTGLGGVFHAAPGSK
jgi:hypothetical protein